MQASSAPHVVITHFSLSQNAQTLVGRYLRHYLLKKWWWESKRRDGKWIKKKKDSWSVEEPEGFVRQEPAGVGGAVPGYLELVPRGSKSSKRQLASHHSEWLRFSFEEWKTNAQRIRWARERREEKIFSELLIPSVSMGVTRPCSRRKNNTFSLKRKYTITFHWEEIMLSLPILMSPNWEVFWPLDFHKGCCFETIKPCVEGLMLWSLKSMSSDMLRRNSIRRQKEKSPFLEWLPAVYLVW